MLRSTPDGVSKLRAPWGDPRPLLRSLCAYLCSACTSLLSSSAQSPLSTASCPPPILLLSSSWRVSQHRTELLSAPLPVPCQGQSRASVGPCTPQPLPCCPDSHPAALLATCPCLQTPCGDSPWGCTGSVSQLGEDILSRVSGVWSCGAACITPGLQNLQPRTQSWSRRGFSSSSCAFCFLLRYKTL